jgi:cation diffusion facilitator CzcD-associated flavoprotein CzcO
VAIIGAGPAGLTAGVWLRRHGMEPTLFEAADRPGGQWYGDGPHAGTWPGMRTNTSRAMTAFSDLDHEADTPVYPTQAAMLTYLDRYAACFGIADRVRAATRVESLERAQGGGWLIRSRQGGGAPRSDVFRRVVVATGRQSAPNMPDIEGLAGFSGAGGARHSVQYRGPAAYRDMRVLVAGCSVSALEIASELAMAGARAVVATNRRQRYILPKILAGIPTDHVAFTRFAALAGEALPLPAIARELKQMVLRTSGNPAQFGAPPPDDDILIAGLSQSQHYLPLVAEGRIRPRPWIARVAGRDVTFADGSIESLDAIIMGTGYRLSLPFVSQEIAAALDLDDTHIDLCDHTFHPDLDGLAFLGLYDLVGPQLPVLELQARWVAYTWASIVPALSETTSRQALEASRARRQGPRHVMMPDMAIMFARRAGVEPDLRRWPDLRRALLFGPLSPASFRIAGPDRRADAPEAAAAAAASFGAITNPHMIEDTYRG